MQLYLLLLFSLLVCTNAIRYKTVITEITEIITVQDNVQDNVQDTVYTYNLTEILNESSSPVLLG